MSSVVQIQPRTGRRSFTLRAYLAGTAATAALLGAVVVVFASLGAYVAFNGLPIGGGQSADEATSIQVAPAAPATAAKRGAQRQANTAASQQNGNGGGPASHPVNRASNGGGTSAGDTAPAQATASPASPASPTGTSTATTSAGASGTVPTSGSAPQAPSNGGGGPLPTPQVTTPDSVSSTVGTVEQTLHSAGIDVPLSQAGSTVDQVAGGLTGGN